MDAGLDELDESPAVRDDVLVLARLLRGCECLAVLAVRVVQERREPGEQAKCQALAAGNRTRQRFGGDHL